VTPSPSHQSERRHRVVLTFNDGLYAKLICPDGGCKPPSFCSECGRDLHDQESEPCYDCAGAVTEECWIKTWFDNCTADELLHGSLTVELDCEWDGDRLVATIGDVANDAPEAARG